MKCDSLSSSVARFLFNLNKKFNYLLATVLTRLEIYSNNLIAQSELRNGDVLPREGVLIRGI